MGCQQEPVLPPMHHQPHDSERQEETEMTEECLGARSFVPGNEHLVLFAVVQDVVRGRLRGFVEEFDQGGQPIRVAFLVVTVEVGRFGLGGFVASHGTV